MRLSEYLEAQNESVAAFSKRSGVARNTVRRLLLGYDAVGANLQKIVEATEGQVTLAELVPPEPQAPDPPRPAA